MRVIQGNVPGSHRWFHYKIYAGQLRKLKAYALRGFTQVSNIPQELTCALSRSHEVTGLWEVLAHRKRIDGKDHSVADTLKYHGRDVSTL